MQSDKGPGPGSLWRWPCGWVTEISSRLAGRVNCCLWIALSWEQQWAWADLLTQRRQERLVISVKTSKLARMAFFITVRANYNPRYALTCLEWEVSGICHHHESHLPPSQRSSTYQRRRCKIERNFPVFLLGFLGQQQYTKKQENLKGFSGDS